MTVIRKMIISQLEFGSPLIWHATSITILLSVETYNLRRSVISCFLTLPDLLYSLQTLFYQWLTLWHWRRRRKRSYEEDNFESRINEIPRHFLYRPQVRKLVVVVFWPCLALTWLNLDVCWWKWVQARFWRFWNKTSNTEKNSEYPCGFEPQIFGFRALSHRDSTVSEVYYEVHMTRVLHTATNFTVRFSPNCVFTILRDWRAFIRNRTIA